MIQAAASYGITQDQVVLLEQTFTLLTQEKLSWGEMWQLRSARNKLTISPLNTCALVYKNENLKEKFSNLLRSNADLHTARVSLFMEDFTNKVKKDPQLSDNLTQLQERLQLTLEEINRYFPKKEGDRAKGVDQEHMKAFWTFLCQKNYSEQMGQTSQALQS